jgi:hypothetical protein
MDAVSRDEIKRPDNLPNGFINLDSAVDRLLVAYERNLLTKPNTRSIITENQRAAYSTAAVLIIRARVSFDAYVTFVMRRMRQLKGRTPYRSEVISLKAVICWLPYYRQRSGEVLAPLTYQSKADRRRQWREWIESARTLNRALSL